MNAMERFTLTADDGAHVGSSPDLELALQMGVMLSQEGVMGGRLIDVTIKDTQSERVVAQLYSSQVRS